MTTEQLAYIVNHINNTSACEHDETREALDVLRKQLNRIERKLDALTKKGRR